MNDTNAADTVTPMVDTNTTNEVEDVSTTNQSEEVTPSTNQSEEVTPSTLTSGSSFETELACHLIAEDFTIFELDGVTRTSSAYEIEGYSFNFCSYLSSGDYFAEYNGQALTGPDYLPSSTDLVEEDQSVIGVSVTHDSEILCDTAGDGSDIQYQFTMVVMCSPSITAQGAGEITGLDSSDLCHPVVTVNHADGCY